MPMFKDGQRVVTPSGEIGEVVFVESTTVHVAIGDGEAERFLPFQPTDLEHLQ